MSGKIAKALIGGNWKCNGTVASIKSMAEVLNKAGPFSANSEVVIAAPSIHLSTLKSILRPDIAVSSEVLMFYHFCFAVRNKVCRFFRMSASREVMVPSLVKPVLRCCWTLKFTGLLLVTLSVVLDSVALENQVKLLV